MASNMIISKSIPKSSGDSASTRIVTVHQTTFEYSGTKQLIEIVKPTTKGADGLYGGDGRKDVSIVDILRITPAISVKGYVSTDETARTTLNGAINSAVTTITLTTIDYVENASTGKPSYLLIDTELIQYTGKSGSTITGCVRGFGGTTAASHLTLANVYHPAFHFRETLRYMIDSGGILSLYYPANVSGNDNTVGGDTVTTASSKYYGGGVKKFSFKEVPTDNPTPEVIEVTLDFTHGENY